MFPEYFVAIVNNKVEFVGARGPRESLEESSCTTYIAAVVVFCLQVQGYCQVQDGLLLLLPASCIGHVHGMCPFHSPSSYYQLVHVYNMETSVSVFISYMWQSQVC